MTRTRAHWLTLTHLVQPVARVTAVARHLAGRVPVAVASAYDGQVVRAGLAVAGLADLFETVIAREHVARLKPDPAAYLLAATELAVPTAWCLAFENTTEGVTAARAADGILGISAQPAPQGLVNPLWRLQNGIGRTFAIHYDPAGQSSLLLGVPATGYTTVQLNAGPSSIRTWSPTGTPASGGSDVPPPWNPPVATFGPTTTQVPWQARA